jgi:uncharacterized surface protein with fasciclin (FAS1) repeats
LNHPKRFLLALAAGVLAAAPAFAVEPTSQGGSVPQVQEGRDLENIVRDRAYLSTFRGFTESIGVYEPLRSPGTDGKGYTIFVPSNNAWAKLTPQVLGEFQRNRDLLEQVLKYHMVAGRYRAADLDGSVTPGSLQGEALAVSRSGNRVHVGSAVVIEADQIGSNGVIHIIDRVLIPPTIRNELNRRGLLPLNDRRAAELGRQPDALGGRNVNDSSTRGITGGAANRGNSSFGIGQNPVTPREGAVRTGSSMRTGSGRAARLANRPRAESLIAVASSTANLSTFHRLATEAGIANTLMQGTHTVFAPTDAAFDALPSMAMEALVADRDLLKQVLLFHVMRGETTSGELKRGNVRTLAGRDVYVRVGPNGAAKVNDAVVLDTDLMARNGAIHTINKVLIPPSVASALRAKGISLDD